MSQKYISIFIAVLASTILLSSCSSTWRLSKDKYLLAKNKIECENCPSEIEEEALSIVKQKPNKKTLGVRLYLWFYNVGNSGKERKFKPLAWLENGLLKFGEEPVVYDSSLTNLSEKQISEFLFQKGYFNNSVSHYTDTSKVKNKIKKSNYVLTLNQPYVISKITRSFHDDGLKKIYTKAGDKSLLKKNAQYDYEVLDKERSRLNRLYKENGYYDFSKEYIKYKVDTNLGNHSIKLTMEVLNPVVENSDGTTSEKAHHTLYRWNNFYVYPNYDFYNQKEYPFTKQRERLEIRYKDTLKINPKILLQNIRYTDYYYDIDLVETSYKNLLNIGIYQNINIEHKKPELESDNPIKLLDTYVYLTPFKRNSFTAETRVESRAISGRNEDGSASFNLGVSGNFTYTRKNAFKNGETVKLGITAGLEPFYLSDSTFSGKFFNTTQIGPSLQISFPKFLLPISIDQFSKRIQAKTFINANYSLLRNDDIRRGASTVNITYQWYETEYKKHSITPAELSLINASLSDALTNRLDDIGDPFLKNAYNNQLILASSYQFVYDKNTNTNINRNRFYNRSKIELAGNLLRKAFELSGAETNEDGSYEIANIPFAQYWLIDNDFRYYTKKASKLGNLAFRIYGGIGKPLQNQRYLPFDRSFFAGGANGIRAWRARTLGPGGYMDTTSFGGILNRLGEIHLEGNIEYRFPIISFLEGALFTDIGNIWMIKEQAGRSNTEFSGDFIKQLAVGAGVGIRFDFDFFIIRFDLAMQMHDPALSDGEKWFWEPKTNYNKVVENYNEEILNNGSTDFQSRYSPRLNFNIGIGYPF